MTYHGTKLNVNFSLHGHIMKVAQSAHPCCLNVYLQLQILAALLKLSAVLNISCTHSAAELLSCSS